MILLLALPEAFARAGGGHSYSSGGDDGGGGGDLGGLIRLLIWLVFEVPVIGVPLLIAFVIWVVWNARRNAGRQGREVYRGPPRRVSSPYQRAPGLDLEPLRRLDPSFSLPLFRDLARLVYLRAHEARGARDWDRVRPWMGEAAFQSLLARAPAGTAAREVVLGRLYVESGRVEPGGDGSGAAVLVVDLEANLVEKPPNQPSQQWLLRERWTFRRRADAPSPGPERMRSLACPACGSPGETWPDGRCRSCDTLLDDGRIQWQVIEARELAREPLPPIALQPGGGVEEGTRAPTVQAGDLGVQLRTLQARDPDFDLTLFIGRATETFTKVQAAWSAGRAEDLRPFESDFLFQQHRFWLSRYAKEGLRNRVEAVQVQSVLPVKVEQDVHVTALTVRIFASCLDWTEDGTGRVLGGSKSERRVFSEYWTFLRARGAPGGRDGLHQCPSCGAPLDRVAETGVCGYCDAKITGGDYDWVVSTIDQDEAYRG